MSGSPPKTLSIQVYFPTTSESSHEFDGDQTVAIISIPLKSSGERMRVKTTEGETLLLGGFSRSPLIGSSLKNWSDCVGEDSCLHRSWSHTGGGLIHVHEGNVGLDVAVKQQSGKKHWVSHQ